VFRVLVDANFATQCGQGWEGMVGLVVGWVDGWKEIRELVSRLNAVSRFVLLAE